MNAVKMQKKYLINMKTSKCSFNVDILIKKSHFYENKIELKFNKIMKICFLVTQFHIKFG